jgi:hypothetical protein
MKEESNRVFGRAKARELTGEEIALVGGGDDGWPEPDVYHSFYCARTMSDGSGTQEPDHIGCVYT